MDGDDRKKAEIIDFLTANSRRKAKATTQPPVKVSGHHNIVGNNNTLVQTEKVIHKTINRISPDDRYITPDQARKIQKKIAHLVDIDAAAGVSSGNRPKLFQKWWSIFKDHFGVATYREIPRERGEQAIAWLTQKAAMKRPQLRRADNPSWRNEHYAAIWARSKQLGLSKADVYWLVFDRMGKQVNSLKNLGERDLRRLYEIIFSL